MLSNEDYLNIFHEVKNSITLISGSLQLVAKKHPEVCDFDYWPEAMSEVSFLKNMVVQLSSARLCSHLNPMQVNVSSFLHQISNSALALSGKDFNCSLTLEDNLPFVEIDPQLFKHALVNLIKNAYEAMNGLKPVDIRAFLRNNLLHITISDCGGGLDPAIADNIFHPFITTKTGGSGLGLVITKEIVEAHHGTITCDSRLGEGCTFTITLPLMQN